MRVQGQHLLKGFEGLLAHVMYVFDDAVVFVNPPPSVAAADGVRLFITNLKGVHGPKLTGQGLAAAAAKQYLKRKKFNHIADFSRQFGEAGFHDLRVTSTLLTEQVQGAQRVPLEDVEAVTFTFRKHLLPPHISIRVARRGAGDALVFSIRYNIHKAQEAHQVLQSVLGARVGPLDPP